MGPPQAGGEGTLSVARLSWGSGCPGEGGTFHAEAGKLAKGVWEQSGAMNAGEDQQEKTQLQAPTRAVPAPYCPKCPKRGPNSVLVDLDTSSLNLFQHPPFFALQDTLS